MKKYLILYTLFVFGCEVNTSDNTLSKVSCHENYNFTEPEEQCLFNSTKDVYRGIWYGQTKLDTKYNYKYAGGLGTYTSHHSPIAIYSNEVNKTFFTYGGTHSYYNFKKSRTIGPDQLYIMISYYDHNTGELSRPTLVFDKWTNDPHDNPVINIDSKGYIWLFVPSHGRLTTPSYILKSRKPYSIDEFEVTEKSLFSYPQPHTDKSGNGVLLYTSYEVGRTLMSRKITNDQVANEGNILSLIGKGHYQVSSSLKNKIGTALNYHPRPGGSDARTNLYYIETDFQAMDWKTIQGEKLDIPLQKVENKALVKDYETDGYLVYLMDIVFDNNDNPVILYNISKKYLPDRNQSERYLKVAFYKDGKWEFVNITYTDHNYNMGTLYADENKWIVAVPTFQGPQMYSAGGEIELWVSTDNGLTWNSEKLLTRNSPLNHNYVRRVVNAEDDFSFIWSSGSGLEASESRLYYSDINGDRVIMMP